MRTLLFVLALTVSPLSTWADIVPIPHKATWESNMTSYGATHCTNMDVLDDTYYDAHQVNYLIADYTGTGSYNTCAHSARTIYRDDYAAANSYILPGYWIFTRGLRLDWERNANATSKNAAESISQNSAYSADGSCCPAPEGYDPEGVDASRETAYSIVSYMDTEAMGYTERSQKDTYIGYALGHINQWCVTFTNPIVGQIWTFKPFMIGLTMRALIQVYEETPPGSRTADMLTIPAKIKVALDCLMSGSLPGAMAGQGAWLSADEAFFYSIEAEPSTCGATPCIELPAADLNLLVAPAFAWYYKHSGNTTYRTWGDAVFSGGVTQAYLTDPKIFNQNYTWSFDYVTWREAADAQYNQKGGDLGM